MFWKYRCEEFLFILFSLLHLNYHQVFLSISDWILDQSTSLCDLGRRKNNVGGKNDILSPHKDAAWSAVNKIRTT